ncbi:hypothetical protein LPJ81_006187 [Coemansia sp. IMI 209127]|nr:hypothetical protein LPJ81_006187 [Coemansia sp. IMI 209127]
MPLLSSQHQVLPQTSVFPVLASSPPIQGSSSFSLLNSNEAMDMTPLHSTSQQDIFAQAGSYPANITSRAAAGAVGGGGGTRVLRRRSQVGSVSGGGLRRASSPGNSSRNHPYMPQTPASSSGAPLGSSPFGLIPSDPTALRRSNSIATLTPYVSNHQVSRSSSRSQKAPSSMFIIPAINQDGTCKRCANCYTAETPSWRRHPDTQELLCNACGLYLRLHRKARPITVDESGNIQVVRKNAAIQREPINLRPATGYFGQTPVLDAPNQNHNQYPHGSMGLQLTSPVHSMDSISSPFNAMHMDHYSHPQASLHALVDEAAVQQYPNVARFPIGSDTLQTKTLIENKCTDGEISGSLFSTSESSMQYSPSYESS